MTSCYFTYSDYIFINRLHFKTAFCLKNTLCPHWHLQKFSKHFFFYFLINLDHIVKIVCSAISVYLLDDIIFLLLE